MPTAPCGAASRALRWPCWSPPAETGAPHPNRRRRPTAHRFASGTIPAQTLTEGQSATVNVASFFTDPDGDALSFTASTSNAGVAAATVSGSTVTITAVAAGTATITVTARDPGGLTAALSANVAVEPANRAPVVTGSVPTQSLTAGQSVQVNLAPFFSDPDGDALTYTAASSNTAIVTASVSGSTVTITAASVGSATITVSAADPGGLFRFAERERHGGDGGCTRPGVYRRYADIHQRVARGDRDGDVHAAQPRKRGVSTDYDSLDAVGRRDDIHGRHGNQFGQD